MSATATPARILVNDEPRELGPDATLAALVRELGLDGRPGIATAVNGGVVPRAEWNRRPLAPGDRVLVIRATQGG